MDSGKLDGTQSEFWISVYDNIKGQNAGAEYQTAKAIAYNEWWAENVENDDFAGSLFQAWSSEFDSRSMFCIESDVQVENIKILNRSPKTLEKRALRT